MDMTKKRKRTCWVLQGEWELYGEKGNSTELFSSLKKAQIKMTSLVRDDINEYIDRFDFFEYEDSHGILCYNKIPMEVLKGNFQNDYVKSKWINMYTNSDTDYIKYEISKEEIK